MHKRFLSTILLVAVMLVARPAFAETSLGSLEALIQTLMVQVQELQRQLVILQDEAGSTNVASAIRVLYPNGGEVLKFGDMIDIVWSDNPVSPVAAHYDVYAQSVGTDTGKRFLLNSAIPHSSDGKQILEWEVGTEGRAGAAIPLGYYYIEVCPWSHVGYSKPPCDRSDTKFKITDEGQTTDDYIKVTNPNGGEVLYTGKTARITWDKRFDGKDGRVSITLKSECPMLTSATGGVIVSDTGNTGEYVWNVPSKYANDKCGYKVRIATIPGTTASMVSDESNGWFEIQSGQTTYESIDVYSPEDGGVYKAGQPIPVTFNVLSPDEKPDVEIILYQFDDNGKRFPVNNVVYAYEDGFIENGKNTINFYPEKGTGYPTGFFTGTHEIEVRVGKYMCCKPWIEATDSDMTGKFTISSGSTTIPSIQVVSPNGGGYAYKGTSRKVTWKSENLGSLAIEIILLNESGEIAQRVALGVPNTGSYYPWVVSTDLPDGKYKMGVYSQDKGPSAGDMSDQWITVVPQTTTTSVLGASASYQDVLNQMANTLKGMQELLLGLK